MKIVVGNQKNYMTLNDVKNFLDNANLSDNCVICPSNIYMPYFLEKDYNVGLQNININETITGEISIEQANSLGIKYAIIGHSERRNNLFETNNMINEKVKSINKINIILCIGESLKDKNKREKVLEKQILECLDDANIDNVIIAYEPVWAIGTGIPLTNEEIDKTSKFIKKIIKETYNKDIKVLYGGSVNSRNIKLLNTIDSIDGFLIGKASTNPIEFNDIIKVVS